MIGRSDAELVIGSLDEPARFGGIFDRHAETVFRYLARRIGPDDASDLLADVFLAAFEARSRYASDCLTALPWLYGIASNLLRKHYRRRAGELRMLDRLAAQSAPDDHVDAVADVIDAQLQVRAMAKLLDELPPGERDVLLLHAWEALTYEETANALNIPVGTVRSRLNRTRRKLRAGVDEIDRIRSVRPDRLTTIPDVTWAVLARVKERLMQAIEGKTKIIIDAGDGTVLIRSKDDITAGDGAKHDVIEGKAASSTTTTCNIFRLLDNNRVPTHFVERLDAVTFRARKVEMIPLELVARRMATGSFLDRNTDIADGTVFADLVFEVFEKDDANHDPLLEFDFARDVLRRFVPNTKAALQLGDVHAGDLISEEMLSHSRYAAVTSELLEQLRHLTVRTFEIVEQAWARLGGTYFDFKIECGFDHETGALLVADVIDSDSGRLRFGNKDMSKQAYRDASQSLPDIKKNFDEVAELTRQFV
ncbi:MAG TPA: phosphoribosylaminoimidazolesuccinocarboxamide synthase [Acidimicrobiales bacterium]|nr:phosphoribosylaminoimidazolesuccinocarboxamide synthase [Acidimicrobiales bacterium]